MLKIDATPAISIHAAAVALAASLMSTMPAAAANPSFACTGNLLPAEAVICSDDGLAALDRQLAADYKAEFDSMSAAQRTTLENAEKAWIAERNGCGTNRSCISNAYQVRIGQLAPTAKPAIPTASANPSFACTGNLVPAEAVVCSNASLAALDRTLAADYQRQYDNISAAQRTALENAEKTWIAERNSCGTNVSCISNAYQVRIGQLAVAPAPVPLRPATANPSFACTGNLLPTEAVICSNTSLAALDRQLAAEYTSRFDKLSAAQRTTLENAEKAWLAERNSCGTNVSCITNAYEVRISNLK